MEPDEEPAEIQQTDEERPQTRILDSLPTLRKNVIPLVFGVILLLGAYFQALGLWDASSADVALLTWSRIPAVLLASGAFPQDVTEYVGSHGGDSVRQIRLNSGLDLRYRYTFKGKTYDSQSFGIGYWTTSPGDAGVSTDEWIKKHPKGSVLRVYVNPSDPEMSAVSPSPSYSALVCMLVALPFTLVGLAVVLPDRAQSKLSFETISVAWCGLILAIYVIGHAVTVAVALTLVGFVLAVAWLNRIVAKYPLSNLEENLEAPPQDIADFRG